MRRCLCLFGASAGTLALTTNLVASVGTKQLPPLPLWPCRVVARLPLQSVSELECATAQLDGRSGQELLVVPKPLHEETPSNTSLLVYSWRGRRFRQVAARTLPTHIGHFTVGDVDRDGHDEIFVLNGRNEIMTLRLAGGGLRAGHVQRLTTGIIDSITLSDVRRSGRPELVVALNPQSRFDQDEELHANRLAAFRWQQGRWVKTWTRPVELRAFRLELLAGEYHPHTGHELVFRHFPSGIDEMPYDLWRWGRGRLARFFTEDQGPRPPVGMQRWVGAARGLAGREVAIVSETSYLLDAQSGNVRSRGEILLWKRGKPRAAFRLPGEPLAVADFRRHGRAGVLVKSSRGGCVLLEPSRS